MRTSVLAAGGIVLRRGGEPLFAVVRMRKRNDWVLPKGKLDDGETPRQAAEREVLEETGHLVTVHEFVGTLVYESGGRSKVVHFWRMEAEAEQTLPLMKDIRAVDWLPLEHAVARLTRYYEQAFLGQVGPTVLAAAAGVPRAGRDRADAVERVAEIPASGAHRATIEPGDDELITKIQDGPPPAVEQVPDVVAPKPGTMMQRIRRWLRGLSRT